MATLNEYFNLAIKVSRIRFWFYVAGPFTVGCIYGTQRLLDLATPEFFTYMFYFLIPANIFLYGVNDYYDYETDLLNPKKQGKEYLVPEEERKILRNLLIITGALSLILIPFQKDNTERIIFTSFLFLSYFYSAKPLRFKAIPFLDSASNILYVLPGVFSYYQVTGNLPPTIIIAGAFLHTSAMHLFSAVPDIEFDKQVNLKTTAVFLGEKPSLILCLILWTGLAAISLIADNYSFFSFLPLIYPAMVTYLLLAKRKTETVYWFYPYINTGLGGLLFLIGAYQTPF